MAQQASIIDDDDSLLEYGICRAPLPEWFDCEKFGNELSKVTPMILTAEDGEYPFYRNILDEPDFPFDELLTEKTAVGKVSLDLQSNPRSKCELATRTTTKGFADCLILLPSS